MYPSNHSQNPPSYRDLQSVLKQGKGKALFSRKKNNSIWFNLTIKSGLQSPWVLDFNKRKPSWQLTLTNFKLRRFDTKRSYHFVTIAIAAKCKSGINRKHCLPISSTFPRNFCSSSSFPVVSSILTRQTLSSTNRLDWISRWQFVIVGRSS